MRNWAVPMKRAKVSLQRPKVSWLSVGRGSRTRRVSRGWSRRAAGARLPWSATGHLATLLAPVVGEDVVQDVVHGHRAEQPPVLVDDRDAHEVVRRQHAGDLAEGRVGRQRLDLLVEDRTDGAVRWLAQQPLDVDHPEVPAGR